MSRFRFDLLLLYGKYSSESYLYFGVSTYQVSCSCYLHTVLSHIHMDSCPALLRLHFMRPSYLALSFTCSYLLA